MENTVAVCKRFETALGECSILFMLCNEVNPILYVWQCSTVEFSVNCVGHEKSFETLVDSLLTRCLWFPDGKLGLLLWNVATHLWSY